MKGIKSEALKMQQEKKLHVVLALEDKNGEYSINLGILLVSIMENTKEKFCFHVLHDDTLLETNKRKLLTICLKYKQEIIFHRIFLTIEFKDNPVFESELMSPATLYRLYLIELLENEKKALYLDCDIIVNGDIAEMFKIEMEEYAILAVKDKGMEKNPWLYTRYMPVDSEKYFNAGVILFNLEKIRKHYNVKQDSLWLLKKYPKDPFSDQSALNCLFKDDCMFISQKYNNFVNECSEIDETVIWHFAGACKPWKIRSSKIDILYWKYFRLTPWGENVDFLFSCYAKTVEPLSIAMKTYPTGPKRQFFKNAIKRMLREIIEIKKNFYS